LIYTINIFEKEINIIKNKIVNEENERIKLKQDEKNKES
jgi:hypothetical protein